MTRPFRLTAPVPLERDTHKAVARLLDRLLLPPSVWFTYPAGATILSPQQAARHVEIGLKRGLPDIWILYNGVYCIELKRPGGALSKTRITYTKRGAPRIIVGQTEIFPRLILTGAIREIAVCKSVDDVLSCLTRWQIPMRRPLSADLRFTTNTPTSPPPSSSTTTKAPRRSAKSRSREIPSSFTPTSSSKPV